MAWSISFLTFTPSSYDGIVSRVFVTLWAAAVLVGLTTAIVGVFIRSDVKAELAGLYIAISGVGTYLVAQAGFFGAENWHDRIAFTLFIFFHGVLMSPRLVALEAYRRRARDAARAARALGGRR